ncbi:unnamed protein product [Parascedosporium putredinis]|uniref:Uncharacterized protein n=1 Tax=Parascedosporium putredinis TaxID=1442378 RepID=A0A9P1M5M7_9PEZI|nr:unnamed protein product [Parascedosporium putredinis]CAI7988224.1 unnamed protein product [Parascedosporium putredinis]
MRKALFPLHQNLRLGGKLPSLDMPHHPHPKEWIPYREGVTISRPKGKTGSPSTRVTLHFATETTTTPEAVHPLPHAPRAATTGASPSAAAPPSPPSSQRAHTRTATTSASAPRSAASPCPAPSPGKIPDFKHLLVVFGGPKGIEYAAGNDPELGKMLQEGTKTRELFDHWINVLPGQGSRTIRTEEAMFIGLTALGGLFESS